MRYNVPIRRVPFGLPVEFEGLSGSYLRVRLKNMPGVVPLMRVESGVILWVNPETTLCRPARDPSINPKVGDSMGPINIGGGSHDCYYHVVREGMAPCLGETTPCILGIAYSRSESPEFYMPLDRWQELAADHAVRHSGLDFWLRS